VNFVPSKIPLRGNSCQKCIYSLPAQVTAKHRAKFGWLALSDVGRCSKEAKMQKPLKLTGVPQSTRSISAASAPKFTIL